MVHADLWQQLLEVYFATKRIYAISEETDEDLMTNLQPLNEFRAALDHVMRSIAVDYPDVVAALTDEALPENFSEQNLRSATSHMYRAFFDVCDSVSINYREKIRSDLEGFSKEAISAAIPDYYSVIRPDIEEISHDIASMRMSKGQNPARKTQDINSYTAAIEKLANYVKKVNSAQVSLLELKKEEEKRSRSDRRKNVAFYVVVPLLCAIGAFIAGKLV